MNKKWAFVFIALYLISLASNLMVSAMFPDLEIRAVHFIASMLLFIVLIFSIFKAVRYTKWFFLTGAASSVFVALAQYLEGQLMGNLAFDMLSGLQYPLYVLFITPLFGLNYAFDMLPGKFALLCAGLFIFLLIVAKLVKQSAKMVWEISKGGDEYYRFY